MAEYKDYGYQNTLADHSHQYLLQPILSGLDPKKNTNILDLGCGNGSFANALIEKGYNVYGTDASELGIAQANSLHPGRFFVQDLSSDELPLQLKEIKFDTIISTEVIEHLYDPKSFIRFAQNILLKNGSGEIIISTPYHGFLKNLALALTNSWDKHHGPLWDGGHIKFWSRGTLTQLLTDHGFTVTSFKGCGRFAYLWKSMVITAKLSNS
jgi:2-polyprenyl-3-methyl-5-hydroxy-6-metoxy-1,4-benzoquinol methylase